jgi:hypothetical protein
VHVGTAYGHCSLTAKPDGDNRTDSNGCFFVPEKKDCMNLATFSEITDGTMLKGYYSRFHFILQF